MHRLLICLCLVLPPSASAQVAARVYEVERPTVEVAADLSVMGYREATGTLVSPGVSVGVTYRALYATGRVGFEDGAIATSVDAGLNWEPIRLGAGARFGGVEDPSADVYLAGRATLEATGGLGLFVRGALGFTHRMLGAGLSYQFR